MTEPAAVDIGRRVNPSTQTRTMTIIDYKGYRINLVRMPIIWKEITTAFKGQPIRGLYAVENGIVKVRTADGEKEARLGGTNEIWIAARLLRELAAEGRA